MNPIKKFFWSHPAIRNVAQPLLTMRRRYLQSQAAAQWKNVSMIAEDVVVNVPDFGGKFAMSPHSDLFSRLFLHESYEPEIIRIAMSRIDQTRDIVDVGANIGLFTVAMAKRLTQGRILAIEPNPQAHKRLLSNIERNGVGNAIIFEGAVADASGSLDLNFVEGREEYSSIGKISHPSVAAAQKSSMAVPVRRLDDLVSENNLKPAFIKIDVEGAEHLVIRGAMETLRNFRQTILSELCDPFLKGNGSSSREVIEVIRSAGYTVKDALYPDIPPGSRDHCDVICSAV